WSIPEMKFCLFTLIDTWETNTRKITSEMADFVQALRQKVKVVIVGSSDLKKIQEQLGEDDKKKVKA
uniref:Phosphomannomutase n=1 Tax=Pseudonaja textilis TaxID=8673 RepID=A0A670Y9D2_PSETE